MMRALFSSVAGLKSHQTKMDVIGNNIANVNTVGFKSSRTTFSTMMYQTTSGASGANAALGTGGVNAKQIGLGANFASTMVTVSTGGAPETTGGAFDLKISDTSSTSFFIVNNGSENLFTRAGAFYVDGAGNLCMESTGYTVMGWQVDANGNIKKDTVSPLKIMSDSNQTSQPEYTNKARCNGILDDNSANVSMDTGYNMNLILYDNLGYAYTAKFAVQIGSEDGQYTVNLTDILDSNGESIITEESGLGLGDLFTTGSSSNAQGSNVDITDNYTMASGMASMLKNLAGTLDDSGNRTFVFSAEVLNEYLGPFENDDASVSWEFPEGYTVEYTIAGDATNPNDLTATTGDGTFIIKDASGSPVDMTTEPYATLFDSNTNITKVVTPEDLVEGWYDAGRLSFESIALDADANEPAGVPDPVQRAQLTDTQIAELKNMGAEIPEDQNVFVYIDNSGDFQFDTVTAAQLAGVQATYTLNNYLDRSYLEVNANDINSRNIFTTDLPKDVELRYNPGDGSYKIVTPSTDGFKIQFSTVDGSLTYIGTDGSTSQVLQLSKFTNGNFSDIEIDFTNLKNLANSGSSTAAMVGGDADGDGKGKKIGKLSGLSVDGSGKIFGTYDNGNTVLLGQIAVARFANASGLESIGDNCFRTTLNSGEFDGIGVEIDGDGSSISTGQLEMSNVDLATEFTQMITTQRGYQANSRVITTSDSILEELINLKR